MNCHQLSTALERKLSDNGAAIRAIPDRQPWLIVHIIRMDQRRGAFLIASQIAVCDGHKQRDTSRIAHEM
jgi:hypothetical protein